MSTNTEFKEDHLPDLLPLYYRRIFPYNLFHKWLSGGDDNVFSKRELSFTLFGDVYIRFLSFNTLEEFMQELQRRIPIKIDIGAIYSNAPKDRKRCNLLKPLERELVFDIDMTDYDEVRTCCSGADVCLKCWKFMVIACKIIDVALREDFGLNNLLWVFSGRRGIHCWVCDRSVMGRDDLQRSAIAEYLQIIKGGADEPKKVYLPFERIHSSIRRALAIIKPYFLDMIIKEQNVLGTNKGLSTFLSMIENNYKGKFEGVISKGSTSEERWKYFENCYDELHSKHQLPKNMRNLKEEIMLQYTYPRLDINVSKSTNHLLKAPFCVHPKTGKVCVPISAKTIEKFDPDNVPTINLLADEINQYDAKTKEQQATYEEGSQENIISRVKDYKKTSLLKYASIFEEFIRGIERATKQLTQPMEF